MFKTSSILSLVVPAISLTMALSSFNSEFSKYEWQKDHQENKTGTKEAYSPNKYKVQTKADYESWHP